MLRHNADAYVFNGDEPQAMLEACRGWWREPEERQKETALMWQRIRCVQR